jgi:hypothetical protein
MTVEQIIHQLKPEKPISRETFYQYARRFKIKPLGIRQRPQLYPADTVVRLKLKLGLIPAGKVTVTPKLTSKITSKNRR